MYYVDIRILVYAIGIYCYNSTKIKIINTVGIIFSLFLKVCTYL